MLFNNSAEAVVTFLALEWVHAVAAPVDPNMDLERLARAVENLDAGLIISNYVERGVRDENDVQTKAEAVAAKLGLKHWSTARSTNRGVYLDATDPLGIPAWSGGSADYTLDRDEVRRA